MKWEKRAGFPGVIAFGCAILAFVLFRWTPATGRGFVVFVALLVLVIVMLIVLSKRDREDHDDGQK